jgi:hypothetical protein
MESECVFSAKGAAFTLPAWDSAPGKKYVPKCMKARSNSMSVTQCRIESRFQRSFTNMPEIPRAMPQADVRSAFGAKHIRIKDQRSKIDSRGRFGSR